MLSNEFQCEIWSVKVTFKFDFEPIIRRNNSSILNVKVHLRLALSTHGRRTCHIVLPVFISILYTTLVNDLLLSSLDHENIYRKFLQNIYFADYFVIWHWCIAISLFIGWKLYHILCLLVYFTGLLLSKCF